ncbi:MAG TPA: TolC family protein [Sunxiuqinia sp.]|nr:TolC family protein [Sunxiuqinia sp.]
MKDTMIKNSLLILLMLMAWPGFAQQDLSLTDAIQTALKNNYDVQITRQDQNIAEIKNNWGTAGRYPYINLSADSRFNSNQNDNEDFTQSQYIGSVSMNWTLFDGFSVRINKQKLEELEKLSKQNTGIMLESTIQSVILAYYSVLLEKEKMQVYKEVMSLSEDRYQKIMMQKDLGSAVTYDVLQAQNAYLADKSAYLLQQVAYKNAIRDLNYLMAVSDHPNYKLTDQFSAIPMDYTLDELEQQMVANNKSLKNQYINQNLLEKAVALAKSDYSPSLSFAGGITGSRVGTDYATRSLSWNNSANFYGNFTLSFNLFSGGTRKRALQIAQIDQEVGQVELAQIKHELTNRLSNIFEYYQVRKELLKVAKENLKAAELNLQISKEKFDSGAINSFNYRDVQNIYLNAALQELEAIYNFIDTHTTLLRMTGTIIQQYNP